MAFLWWLRETKPKDEVNEMKEVFDMLDIFFPGNLAVTHTLQVLN